MLLLDKKILDFLKNRLFFHYILNSSYLVFRLDLPFINTLCTQHVAHLHIHYTVCILLLEPDSAVSVFFTCLTKSYIEYDGRGKREGGFQLNGNLRWVYT